MLKENPFYKEVVKTNAPETNKVTSEFFKLAEDYDDTTKMQLVDINTWLIGDILLKADKMSMAHSLELRVPFLDKEVFKLARTIPLKYKVNKENTKFALRMAARRVIPKKVADKKNHILGNLLQENYLFMKS